MKERAQEKTAQDIRRTEFLHVVRTLYPGGEELAHIDVGGTLEDFWYTICRVLHIRPEKLAEKIADHLGITAESHLRPADSAIALIPENFAKREAVLPVRLENKELLVALCHIPDEKLSQALRFLCQATIRFVLTTPVELVYATQFAYSQEKTAKNMGGTLDLNAAPTGEEYALIKLAKFLLHYCLDHYASDLHIQAFLGGGVARARVDGMLRRVTLLPEKVYISLCRFLKVNANMDPTNDRIPQDGRMSLVTDGKQIDMRLSSLPTRGGERLVIRFLDQSRNFRLDDNGFALKEVQFLRRLAHSASGMFLITGPTGSGKTSTLYALLSDLNSFQRNILTVENPVEYQLPGISQVEINDKAGLSFSAALRSALRQDPDIILVGEIRDKETAEIAIQAALTGHLVFSTLHTNDALTTIPRLLDLGIDRSILADALLGVSAQRLCRRLCPDCRISVADQLFPDEEAFQKITKIAPPYRPVGCTTCGYTGYRGRLPIIEIIEMNEILRQAILDQQRVTRLQLDAYDANALSTMALSAARHIISGETSVGEVIRILGQGFWYTLMQQYQVEHFEIPSWTDPQEEGEAPGVLLLGLDQQLGQELKIVLEEHFFDFYQADDPPAAEQLLRENANIVYVIADLASNRTDEELCQYVHQARRHLAWSRLLATVLIPEGRTLLPARLKEQGAVSPCLFKPIAAHQLVEEVKNALSYLKENATVQLEL